MRTKSHRKGHNKGIHEVVSRDYTHVGWQITRGASNTPRKTRGYDAHHDCRQR